ncbi:MAG: bacterioferritin-associated ferredoxin [Bdellovibrionales bacterium]
MAKNEKANPNKFEHSSHSRSNKGERFVCYCNRVPKEPIEAAIRRGCDSLIKIFDATNAGVGACGGSCRPYLQKMLDSFEATGQFPEQPRPGRGPTKRKQPGTGSGG